MEFSFSNRFKKDFKKLNSEEKRTLASKLGLLSENQYHPSLRTKKVQGTDDIFECSINMSIRMTWQYREETIFLRTVGNHDNVLNNP
jgi:mRNA interferase RelE/StbE